MTGRLLMTSEQCAADVAGWLARRRRTPDGRWCVTASEIPKACGIAPPKWGGPFSLYHDKLTGKDSRDAAEMRRGTTLEPVVLGDFADAYPGLALLPGGLYAHADDDRWLATPDGLAVEYGTLQAAGYHACVTGEDVRAVLAAAAELYVVQAKTSHPTDGWGWSEDSGQVPDHIRAQVLWEMFVTGAVLGFVVVKFMVSWETRVYQIPMDDQARGELEWMLSEAELFTKRLLSGDEPDVDWFPATTETLKRIYDGIEDREVKIPWRLALRYRAACAAVKAAEARKGLAVNQMLDRAGNAGTIVTVDPAHPRTVIKVASRTAGPMPERVMKAVDRVQRTNPSGWVKRTGRWADQ